MVETSSLLLATLAASEPAMSSGMRAAMFGLIALFLLILACLVVCVALLRRHARAARRRERERPREGQERPAPARQGEGATFAVEATSADPMACPACRRELGHGLVFCPYDASRLVPAGQMLDYLVDKRQARICALCHRAFDSTVRYCPHDGSDLVSGVISPESCDHDTTGEHAVDAKICPRCQGRYDYGALFCGKDGVELVVLN